MNSLYAKMEVYFKRTLDQMQKALECSICLELLSNPVSTKCGHQFCKFCITKFLEVKRSVACPLCKVPVTKRGLQERSELSVLIDNLKKLVRVYEIDTEAKNDRNEDKQAVLQSSKDLKCDVKVVDTYIKKAAGGDSCPTSGLWNGRHEQQGPEIVRHEQAHKIPTSDLLKFPKTRFRTRIKTGSSFVNTLPDHCPPDETPGKMQSNIQLLRNRTSRKLEKSNSESEGSILQVEKKEKAPKNSVQHNGLSDNQRNGDHKHDENNKDLLRYLEEGSCGAAFHVESTNENESTNVVSVELKNTSDRKHSKLNDDHTTKIGQRAQRASCKITDFSMVADNNKKKSLSQRSSETKLPLSPSKLNSLGTSPGKEFKITSKILLSTNKHSVSKENMAVDAESEEGLMPILDSDSTPQDLSKQVLSPASDVSSVSSTQQLMKHRPVTARTYSRDMRRSFHVGFVKNWADTLPQDNEEHKSELHQPRGLTMKEKINAKKQGHLKDQQSTKPQAGVTNHLIQEDGHLIPTDASKSKEGLLNPNERSQIHFDISLTPVSRRKNIFRSRVVNTEGRKSAACSDIVPTQLIQEDPYEFKVGHTPIKSKRKTADQKGRLITDKPNQNVAKSQQRKTQIKSRKCTDVKQESVSLGSEHTSDKLHVLESVETCSKNRTSDFSTGKSERQDKHETTGFYLQTKNMLNLRTRNKTVSFSSDLVETSDAFIKRVAITNISVNESSSAVKVNMNFEADGQGAAVNQVNHGLFQEKVVPSDDIHEIAESSVCNSVSETTIISAPGVNTAETLLEPDKIISEIHKKEIYNGENTNCIQTYACDIDMDHLPTCSNQQVHMTHQQSEEDIVSLPQSKNSVTQKRKFARRKKNRYSDTEAFSQKSGKEMVKLIHNISQAEDYELLFSTQDAHAKLQEDIFTEQLHKTAFGFDELEFDNYTADTVEKMVDKSNKGSLEVINNQFQIPEVNSSPEHCKTNNTHENLIGSVKDKLVSDKGRMTPENSEVVKISDSVNQLPTIDKSGSNKIKSTDISVKENIADYQGESEVDLSVSRDNNKFISQIEHTLLPKTGKHYGGNVKERVHNFSRPNLSEMIQVSLSTANICAVSNLVAPRDGGIELKHSLISDSSNKISNMMEGNGFQTEQLRVDFEESISSDDHVSLISNRELAGNKEHKLNEKNFSVVQDAFQEDVHKNPYSLANDESVKPFPNNLNKPSPSENKALIDTSSLGPQESTRKISHVSQLSLKSNVAKTINTSPEKKSTGLTSYTTNHDVILAPDTCMDNITGQFVNEGNKKFDEYSGPIVLETLDYNADYEFAHTGDRTSPVCFSSYSQLRLISSEQDKIDIDSTKMERTSGEAIAETQHWSSLSTESPLIETIEFVPGEVINSQSSDLKVSCNRSKIACSDTNVLTNLDLSQVGKALLHPTSAADETQETGSGSSILSLSMLQPPGMKGLVSDHQKDLAHHVNSVSECPGQSSPKTLPPDNTKSSDHAVNMTPVAQVSPQNQASSAPSRFNFSESEDEDHVLIVRRKKLKCFSLSDSPLKPVVFLNRQKNMKEDLLDLCGNKQQFMEEEQTLADREQYVENNMIGVTEAMSIIDTWTEDAQQEHDIVAGARLDMVHVSDTETNCLISNNTPEHLVEVTPIGKLKYVDSSGKFVIDVSDDSEDISLQRKSKKRLFSVMSKTYLTRSARKEKMKDDCGSQAEGESLIKLDDAWNEDHNTSRAFIQDIFSVPETNISSQDDYAHMEDVIGLVNSVVDVDLDQFQTELRKEIEKSTCSTDSDITGSLKKVIRTKRGLAKKGNLNLDQSFKHPRGLLSPASKAAIRGGVERQAHENSKCAEPTIRSEVERQVLAISPCSDPAIRDVVKRQAHENSTCAVPTVREVERQAHATSPYVDSTITTNNAEKTDTGAEVNECKQDKLTHNKSNADVTLCASKDDKNMLRCSQHSDSDLVTAKSQSRSRKHKHLEKTPTAKVKKLKRDLQDDDEKKRLEKELFGIEVKSNKEKKNKDEPADKTKFNFVKGLGRDVPTSVIGHLNDEDDDNDLVFDLGDSTDDEIDMGRCMSGKARFDTNKEIEIDLTEQPDESFKSSGSLPLTSSPVEVGGNTKQQNIDQSAINAVNETDDEDDNDDSVYVRPKTRMRRLQIVSDSDDSDQEVAQAQSPTNCTSSSAFSSQSEMLTTEQQEALEKDVAKLHKQIAEYEAKLGQQNVDITHTENIPKGSDKNESAKPSNIAVSLEDTAGATSVDVDDEDSNDLFVSPLSPSPPPRQPSVLPVPRRPALSKSTRQMDQYIKQFQSPGGTVRTKKSLEFTQSSALPQSQNKHLTQSKSLTTTTTSENSQKMQNVTNKQSYNKISLNVASKDIVSKSHITMDLTVDVNNAIENQQDNCLSSPALLSQKSRQALFQTVKMDQDSSVTSRNFRNQSKKDISLVTSGLGSQENMMVMKLVEKQGLMFSSKFTKEVTHVVMKPAPGFDRVCDRTLKFFQGVAHKCWVVAFSWVLDSIQAGCLLPEEDYEILGDTSNGDTTLGAKHSRLCKDLLFSEFCFACVGNSSEMPKESLQDLLTVCGAVVVDDPIGLFSKVAKYKIIVRCSDSEVAPTTAELDMFSGLYKHMGLLTVMREWVLDSLGCYKVQPLADFVLTIGSNVSVPF